MVSRAQQANRRADSRRKVPRRWGFLPQMVVLALLLPACDCGPPRSKRWRYAPPPEEIPPAPRSEDLDLGNSAQLDTQRTRGHTLRIHMGARPTHLNPVVLPSVWTRRIVMDTVYETLIRYEPPERGAGTGLGSYQPGLARSWRVSPDGRVILLELQPNVHFHDGKPFSSVDVQYSLERAHLERRAHHLRQQLAAIDSVEMVNQRSVRIRLHRSNGYILRALAQVPILPFHVHGRKRLEPRKGPVIGTGPYKLAEWTDKKIKLSRFDKYWGKAVAIPDIEFIYEPDAARALNAAKRGGIDIIPALIPEHHPEQANAPGLRSQFRQLRLRPAAFNYLAINSSKAPFDDVRVRKAISMMIDRATLAKDIHDGLVRPIAGPVWPGGPGDGASPAPVRYDPGTAGDLLDRAGWRDGDRDGKRERAGKRLRISLLSLPTPDPERTMIRKSLRRMGIAVDLRKGPREFLETRLRSHDFQLALIRWQGHVDQDLWPMLHSKGRLNYGKFSDPEIDKLLDGLRAVWDPSSRAPLMRKLSRAIAEKHPFAALRADDPHGLIHRRVQGVIVWDGWIPLRRLSFADHDE